jgi:hypothetical protein
MDISDIKTKKEIVVREPEKDIISREPKYEEIYPAKKEEGKIKSYMQKRRLEAPKRKQEKLEKQQKKLEVQEEKYQKLQGKIKMQEAKAKLAEAKAKKKQYSPLRKIPGLARGLSARPESKGAVYREKRLASEADLKRQIALQRGATAYEREQYAKYGIKGEGEGELPYYEKEHKRPLPEKVAPTIGITNHHNIPRKKSLKDELF